MVKMKFNLEGNQYLVIHAILKDECKNSGYYREYEYDRSYYAVKAEIDDYGIHFSAGGHKCYLESANYDFEFTIGYF